MANFKRFNRYTNVSIESNRSGQEFLTLRYPLELEEAEDDVFFKVTKEIEKRPDLISYEVYKSPDFWWAIYEFNGIQDPFFEVRQGHLLRIPSLDRVIAAIKKMGK